MRRFAGVLLLGALLVACGGGSNGNKIAFTSDRDGDEEIFVMNANGTGVHQLTDNDDVDWNAAWSPNGNKIAFSSEGEVFVMNANGTGVHQLTDNDDYDMSPVWSPNGNKIAFTSDRYGDWEIFVMNADGSNVVSLGQQGVVSSWVG